MGRERVLAEPSLIPAARGVYAWFFQEVPPGVPVEGCLTRGGATLLYVGISPKNERSRSTLRKRIVYHYRGNAEGSTLRLTLGTLLAPLSDYPLRRVGSGKRFTFTHLGEQWLDRWLADNARVCWLEHEAPWALERQLLERYNLPLNIQDNAHHPYAAALSAVRKAARREALNTPIADERNQQRRMVLSDFA